MSALVLVVAAIIVDDLLAPSALLAARRSRPAHLVGRWEFPGGKVEPAETPEQGLRRELREELGIEVELGAEHVGPDAGPGGPGWVITDRHVMRLWFARIVEGEPAPLVEHDELRWLVPEALGTVQWLDGDVRIVESLAGKFVGAGPDGYQAEGR